MDRASPSCYGAPVMEGILEALLEFVAEVLLQIVGEALAELGVRSVGHVLSSERPRNPLLAALGYVILGASLGGLSLLAWPEALVPDPRLRLLYLFLSPAVAGLLMASVGAVLRRRGKVSIRLESFAFGFLFAFSLSLVRFLAT